MKLRSSFRHLIITIICYLYILLFVYAAVSKLLDFENFQAQLGQSPLLSAFAGVVSVAVLVAELVIAVLLSTKRFRNVGLVAGFSLMVMFTTYIIIILNFSSFIPCSCGGILEKMDWTQHLVFNSIFVALGLAALYLVSISCRWFIKTIMIGLLSVGFVALLYISSEDLMQRQNPFIRRLAQQAVTQTAEKVLHYENYYFAGADDKYVYLGNTSAPLQLKILDTALNEVTTIGIRLDNYKQPFRAVQVYVAQPFFYVADGSVPVILRGNTSDWKARTIIQGMQHFTKLRPAGSGILFRALERKSGENILGRFKLNDSIESYFAPKLLERQVDGLFDTDGSLLYSEKFRRMVYLYNYRNQFIVADQNLNLIYRGNTIDTIRKAQLKVAHLQNSGDRLLSAPPLRVNKTGAVSGKYLFVNSALRGRYESVNRWKNTSAIDVYDIVTNRYLSSFYIPDDNGSKLKSFSCTRTHLFALIGDKIRVYELGADYKQK